ncbi:MAG: phosphoribosylanthranilate isomerase [Acidobacteria bacterium]|nr:phosphoribosylanthranilate isomerase [Acidobacteriota bacterium]
MTAQAELFVKICGITELSDAVHAVEQGATALGFVFWSRSPRCISPDRAATITAALRPGVQTVGVFVNEAVDEIRLVADQAGLTTIQLHGDEPASYANELDRSVLRATTVDRIEQVAAAWPADTIFLMDAADPVLRGGTGRTVDWGRAAAAARSWRIVLAGGLTPDNVAEAVDTVRPFGVDVSSGVEDAPGVKNRDKVARFLASARGAGGVRGER